MVWIAFYNPEAIGDVLMLTSGPLEDDFTQTESHGDVTLIKDRRNDQIVSVNIFNQADQLGLEGQGSVNLSSEQVKQINDLLSQESIDLVIDYDNSAKFVVGYVEEAYDHEDSDHLTITQTDNGEEVVQIVCGADNIAEGQYVIVAKPGAVLPNGSVIWAGELRGETSQGMICSTRELGLEDIEDYPGIWELDNDFEPGSSLDEVVAFYRA